MPYTPKKTVRAIHQSGNHYVLQVKRNQKALYQYIANYSEDNKAIDCFEIKETTHGRQTVWKLKVFEIDDESLKKNWINMCRLIVIEKSVCKKGKANTPEANELFTTNSIFYRISDVSLSAEAFAKGIRGHWGIENRIHWVKDVHFKEDSNRIKNDNGAINMAMFNAIALNYLRQNINDSIKTAQIFFCQNVKELYKKIRT